MFSQSIEDYLKIIYKLQHGSDSPTQVTTSILAERMGVTAASATNMIKKLAEVNLLEYAQLLQMLPLVERSRELGRYFFP